MRFLLVSAVTIFFCTALAQHANRLLAEHNNDKVTINKQDDGYRGIWYMNQPSGDEYAYKYSGGLGTYCAKHRPFAVYRPEVQRTFFCFGGTTKDSDRRLVHMVSYFDHRTKTVPRPTILLDKQTSDAHDNPVISIDDEGYLWIFSTSHGTSRPSYIHRSTRPYSIEEFERVKATRATGEQRVVIDKFSYMQAWHVRDRGFLCFFTRYGDPAKRTLMYMTSADGVNWSEWQRLAAIDEGHYQISAVGRDCAGSAFNYHPQGKGLNWRTNLYYLETPDFGKTWQTVDGRPVDVPLTSADNETVVHDYREDKLNVYLKDIRYDEHDRPVILYVTSKGYQSGPKNDPRTWTTARWTGSDWELNKAFTSDNNYDMGSLWIEDDGTWRIIAPTEAGPQPYNPGGEVALWISRDQGRNWGKQRQVTQGSERNHTYVRRAVDAHHDFYGLWADGHGRQPSLSRLYICDRDGNAGMLPRQMSSSTATLQPLPVKAADGFVPLFDGKTLKGWSPLPGGTWSVSDGVIVGNQENTERRHGMLLSDGQYGDFVVRLKYKAIEGNSGLYFRVQKIDHAVSVKGFQAEIDAQGNDVGGLYETLGRAWVVQPKPDDVKKFYKDKDWNEMTVTAIGGDVTVIVNGVKTAALKNDPGARKGHFGLQLHGGQKMHVMFKDIEIKVVE